MSLKKIKEVKTDKGFRRGDIFVYLAVLALFLAVLLWSLFGVKEEALKGFEIYYGNEIVFSYSFTSDGTEIYSDVMQVISDNSESMTIRFEREGKYNEIYVDKTKKSVCVSDANCSNGKDCVHTGALDSTEKSIVCAPHKLKILPFGFSDGEIVTG